MLVEDGTARIGWQSLPVSLMDGNGLLCNHRAVQVYGVPT